MYGILVGFGIFSSLLPVILLLTFYKKGHREYWWPFFLVALVWCIAELLNWTLARCGVNNMIVFHLFGIVSLILYANIFYRLIKSVLFRRILIVSIVLLEMFLIIHPSVYSLWMKPDMVNTMISAFIPFILSIVFFFQLMVNPISVKLVESPYYWFNTAVLIRYGMAFFALIFIEKILNNTGLNIYLWPIVSASNIVYNILFSKGIWLMKRT